MIATRPLLALTVLIPLTAWPIDGRVGGARAAAQPPADAKTRRVPAGEVSGEVVKVAAVQITVKVAETVTVQAGHKTVTYMHRQVSVPQDQTKTVHKEHSYEVADDVTLKQTGAKAGTPKLELKDLQPGDTVQVHLSRPATKPGEKAADPVVTRIDVAARPKK